MIAFTTFTVCLNLVYTMWHHYDKISITKTINNLSKTNYKWQLSVFKCPHNYMCMANVNINGRDVQIKIVVNNVEKSSLWAPWQNGLYKNTQNITKHGVYDDATDIKK